MGMHSLRPSTVSIIWRLPTWRELTLIEAYSARMLPTTSSAPSGNICSDTLDSNASPSMVLPSWISMPA
ncbi:hypothetical protein CF70_033340 [Cupriavidus sp. SK-3]|nr:hypothetical protein CF70_033340 [Cupriavidus sp. SK-3]